MRESTCINCNQPFEYKEIKPVMGLNLGDLRPTICSDPCETQFNQQRRREISKNVFYRILNVMPDVYKGVKMSNFDDLELESTHKQESFKGVEDLIKRFCNSDYWNISLFSPTYGNGKTRLGLYILACLALKGVYKTRDIGSIQDAGYYSAIDIAKILKTESYDSKQYQLKKFYNCRALMIDDLGQEDKFFHNDIAGIIKVREESKLKTIITSNEEPKSLEGKYSGRIISRIFKGSFLVKGNDRRKE